MPKKPIEVRGVSYASRVECAKAFNTTSDHVRRMEREGKLDLLGLGRNHTLMRVELPDRCYRTVKDCADDFGLTTNAVYSLLAKGRVDKLGTGSARDNAWCKGKASGISIPCVVLNVSYRSIKQASRGTRIPYSTLHKIMRPHKQGNGTCQ